MMNHTCFLWPFVVAFTIVYCFERPVKRDPESAILANEMAKVFQTNLVVQKYISRENYLAAIWSYFWKTLELNVYRFDIEIPYDEDIGIFATFVPPFNRATHKSFFSENNWEPVLGRLVLRSTSRDRHVLKNR